MIHRCAHPTCRTSDVAVECPHGLVFCEHCTWEEACDECRYEADLARATGPEAWSIPNAAPVTPRALREPCRCGWPDWLPLGVEPVRVPVVDLSDVLGVVRMESSAWRRTCRACTHPIFPARPSVVHRLAESSGVHNRYHPECVDVGKDIA